MIPERTPALGPRSDDSDAKEARSGQTKAKMDALKMIGEVLETPDDYVALRGRQAKGTKS
jgi:hypothetical protein